MTVGTSDSRVYCCAGVNKNKEILSCIAVNTLSNTINNSWNSCVASGNDRGSNPCTDVVSSSEYYIVVVTRGRHDCMVVVTRGSNTWEVVADVMTDV